MKEVADFETRKQVYSLLLKNPGLNLSRIAEVLNISVPLALYHLRYLEKHEVISSTKEEGYLRYFIKGSVGSKEKKYLSLFRQEIALRIVLFLLKFPYSRHRDILTHFEMSRSLLSYHLKKLVRQGIIAVQSESSERRYHVNDEKAIVHFLMKYESYNILEGITDTWTDFTMR